MCSFDPDMQNECPPCTNGEVFPQSDCTKYHYCSNGVVEDKSCAQSQSWNQDEEMCIDANRSSCFICPNGNRYLYPDDCTKYYECVKGIPEKKTCDKNKRFDQSSQECLDDNGSDLIECNICAHGTSYINPSECYKYYICSYDFLYTMTCAASLVFDPRTASCAPEPSPCKVCSQEKLYKHIDCYKYFACDHDKVIENNCPLGTIWEGEARKCGHSCEACVDGRFYKHSDCNSYYECINGNGHLKKCPDGYVWNDQVFKCVLQMPEYTGSCKACENEDFYEHEHCESYYQCTHGEAVLSDCPSGTVFNLHSKICSTISHRPGCN